MLFAKRPVAGVAQKGLRAHSVDVLEAALALFGNEAGPTELGGAWLRFFRIADRWAEFLANLIACCLLHDLGKANDTFQTAVTRGGRQALRHEHLSALILLEPPFQSWLAANPRLRPAFITGAVLSHHLKASKSPPEKAGYPAFAAQYPNSDCDSIDLLEPAELQEILKLAAARLGLPPPPEVPTVWSFDGSDGLDIFDRAERAVDLIDRTVTDDPLLPALKAALVAADAAGSALAREGAALTPWLRETFSCPPLTGRDIEREVLAKRIAQIEAQKRRHHPDYTFRYGAFQDGAAQLSDRALLLAPCGSGKTLAAWRWIAAQLDAGPRRRALFLYPTRATALGGFKDYVSHAPEAETELLFAGAAFALREMLNNPAESKDEPGADEEERTSALEVWRKRLFAATVDQFLAFMHQDYASLCRLPILVDSVIVIDEVHSFDAGLFATLLRVLERFNFPMLCMTASLPVKRRERLQALGFEVYPSDLRQLEDLHASAGRKRYRVNTLVDHAAARERAVAALAEGLRVLWVVNTVDRCQERAREMERFSPICYHSRFKLIDRNTRHTVLIGRFANEAGPLLAITTQVCEMSLDLDADVLISEYAPITALIQRMGRCNRKEPPRRGLGEVYLYPHKEFAPYEKEEMAHVETFISDLDGQEISQEYLEERLEHYSRLAQVERSRPTAFLDDGLWARGGAEMLRETEGYTVRAVVASDIPEQWIQAAEGLVVPVPAKLATRDERLPRYLRRAPDGHYNDLLGFLRDPALKREDNG